MADEQTQLSTGGTEDDAEKTVKFDNPLWQAGFTSIPNSILMGSDLSVYARQAYAGLSFYAREKEECFPGQEKAAKELGMSERAFREAIRELEKVGLVATKRRRGTSNMYRLLAPAGFAGTNGQIRQDVPVAPAAGADQDRQDVPHKNKQLEVEAEKKKQADSEKEVDEVWAFYVQVFEPGSRVKCGPNRRKGIKRALQEVDVATLKQAISGLYEFRRSKGGDTTIETIWKTYKGTGTMVERINFFASKGKPAAPGGKVFPSASKAIIGQKQTDVQRGHGSVVAATVERAKESEAWLLAHGIETVRREHDGYPVFQPVRSDAA